MGGVVMAHESVRPARAEDIVVRLRLTPEGLRLLREGLECSHVRLDGITGEFDTFDLYVETAVDVGTVPAWDAPHSKRFRAARP